MLVFVSVYGPGTQIKEEKREEFWVDLNECVESFSVNVNIILLGDLNAIVGDEHVVGTTGKYGVPDRNWNGEKLLEMCMERELTIMNTMFKKKRIHKCTFVRMAHGRMVEKALMDYVVVSKRVNGRVLDVNVLRGESA